MMQPLMDRASASPGAETGDEYFQKFRTATVHLIFSGATGAAFY
jgi:hypothetical protein